MIMAGGRGERLRGLTEHRCKPATPFGGKFRIVDFVLSNCVNSGIRQICLLTQYKGQSLIQHVQRGWSYLRGEFGEFIDVIPAQQQIGKHWYLGTADSVYQNLDVIRAHRPKHVLVLAGDHIYKMDYGPMIAYHVEKGADITVGVVEVPIADAREFGVLSVTEWNRVTRFSDKPREPEPMPGRTDASLASMGIYVFSTSLLERLLTEDAADASSSHDFGKNIIPKAIEHLQVFAYPFRNVKTRAQNYWRDVGTVDAFFEANIELVPNSMCTTKSGRSGPIRCSSRRLSLCSMMTGVAAWPSTRWSPADRSSPVLWCANRCCFPACASMKARVCTARSSCRVCASGGARSCGGRSSTRTCRCPTARRSVSTSSPTASATP